MRQTDTGALIAQLRKEQGLTQKQLAEQLHISDRTISKWERGWFLLETVDKSGKIFTTVR